MESMTGFSSSAETVDSHEITVLCKSVNNKGLTVSFKMPRQVAHLEPELTAIARGLFLRGRIDVSISVDAVGEGGLPVPDLDLARAYIRGAEALSGEFFLTSTPDAFNLVTLPGVMRLSDPVTGDGFDSVILSLCRRVLESLRESRRAEGESLSRVFRESLEKIREKALPVHENHSRRVGEIFQNRRKRIHELIGEPVVDEARLVQELALLSDRMDISEEYERLVSHVNAALGVLNGNDCGRKLGFLLQEMHRELNTMGSKADQTDAVHSVIEMKDILGGLREQAANVQ